MTTPRAAVGNASDRKQVKSARQREKRRELEIFQAIQHVMSDADGRRVFWWLISVCGPLQGPYSPGMDSLSLAFNTGKSDIGRFLIDELTKKYPDLYLKMQQEAIDEQKRESAELPPEEEPGIKTESDDVDET